ncbi:MAG: RNA 2',3'-cyclic phosphodiesterase [Thermodesulfobacteriota bacterium]|nr:RNA 2',3'-cyclic phosphodiesterase [Thermodesulfobacteriota bacterium]
MGDKIRTFIAISLPESVRQAMGEAQDRLRKARFNVRWVRREGIHLTLKFLGDIDKGKVEKIQAAMESATKDLGPFTLLGEGVGVFPDFSRPRVIWVGISGEMPLLLDLQRRIDVELKGLGFPKEKRPFKGHLTLGRAKGRLENRKLREALEGLSGFQTASFPVESVVLFQSILRPQGAIYNRLAEARLVSD